MKLVRQFWQLLVAFFCITALTFSARSVTPAHASALPSITYTVTYNGNGSDGGTLPTDSTNYNTGDTVTVLFTPLPTKTGYTFAGWSDGTTTYTSGGTSSFGMDSSNVILTAQWTALPTLGSYATTSVPLSGNQTVTPDAAPANATAVTVSGPTDFKGNLAVNPATGTVTITNAHPAGVYVITITAVGPGGTTTETIELTVQSGTACPGSCFFTAAADVSTGNGPNLLAIGDFNNDGKQDLAIPNYNATTVSIRLGDGSGGFTAAADVSAGNPLIVAVGDFNNDGKQDLAVVTDGDSNPVSIRLGDGSGGFTAAADVNVGNFPTSLAIGDFNNDGKQDLATANYPDNNVSIRLGNGDGTFSGSTNISVGEFPNSIAIGDFNNDGKQDFATANFTSSISPTTVSIRLGDGSGGFSSAADVTAGVGGLAVTMGDFNNDGKQDLAIANYNASSVSIRLGAGDGTFSGSTDVGVGFGPNYIVTGDFNNDGNQDIATANYNNQSISIRIGDGSGGFSGTRNISLNDKPYSLEIGDFNADGVQDFAVSNYNHGNASIRLGDCGYNVTFDANDAAGHMDDQGANTATNLTANTFTRTGYSFNGWNTKADGTGTSYADGASYPFTADATLYAQWLTYTVTFDANGGAGSMNQQYNVTATNLTSNTFTRTNYTFNGWNTNADGVSGTNYADGASYPFTANVTLYARWTINQYTISFNSNGGSAVTAITQNFGSAVSAPTAPTRSGYSFGGWYSNAGLTTAYTFSTMPASSITLYAKWNDNPPTVVSITRVNTSPTAKVSLQFLVTFSEAVTGITSADFSLTKPGITGGAVASVTGSGTTRTVTVNSGTGNGTIRLDIPNTATITDLALNPMTALPFTSGQVYTINKTLTYASTGSQDGWMLESGENTNIGGTFDNTATNLVLGDSATKRQYRGILSFNTSSIPDTATISGVMLKVKQQGIVGGGDPVTIFQGFFVDIKTGFFGTFPALQALDFQAAADKTVGPASIAPVGGFYNFNLLNGIAYINKLSTNNGLTQIRLRFKLDDNNDALANYLSLYSGDAVNAADRPQLVITYSVP